MHGNPPKRGFKSFFCALAIRVTAICLMVKLKMKYLRHPLRTATAAKNLATAYLDLKRFADHSKRHFQGDPRYDLQNVTNGFTSRIDELSDDSEVLERICTAYIKAAKQQKVAPETYQATKWWQQVRQASLGPVIQALQARDLRALDIMYRNFFRDPCAAGLIAVPYGMSKAYFSGTITDIHRHFYLGDALYRIDYWATQTSGHFTLRDLAGPAVGNPFGVLINGTLVRTGAPYQHYCARRTCSQLNPGRGTVVEIGGGFGGMAYYLLRNREKLTYLDFDVPEGIALTSYYLLKAFPGLRFLLYGEKELTKEAIAQADVVLMPIFEMDKLPSRSVDVTFSSHAMSDVSREAMGDYLTTISRVTTNHFLYIGNSQAAKSISELASRNHHFRVVETVSSNWHSHKDPEVSEVECLYRVCSS
jgi:putative sugar O-methyltransferase